MGCLTPQQFNKLIAALGGAVSNEATISYVRATGGGTIAAGAVSVRVFNAGLVNGAFVGVVIKPGEMVELVVPFVNLTFPALSYDGTGTELVITAVWA